MTIAREMSKGLIMQKSVSKATQKPEQAGYSAMKQTSKRANDFTLGRREKVSEAPGSFWNWVSATLVEI